MKFGKRLNQQIQETLPGWRDKFLSYKKLKKLVRLLNGSLEHMKVEAEFVYLLNDEIDKFNAFFMEQEEDFIIRNKYADHQPTLCDEIERMIEPISLQYLRIQELQQRIQDVIDTWGPEGSHLLETDCKKEMAEIRKEIINFHGEMVLLLNYSNINYTGLAKILKKYDKRTGGLLRLPFIQKVLKQPFFTTDLVSKLIKECEHTIAALFPVEEEGKKERREAISAAGEGIFRNTVAALVTMQEMRSGSSTYSHYSLPPLNLPDSDVIQSLQLNSPIPIL